MRYGKEEQVANDMMMAFAKEILGKTDHLEDKLAFLKLQPAKEYFYAYLRCFICGMGCQRAREIFDEGKHTVEDILEMMLDDLGERLADHGRYAKEAEALQEETERLKKELREVEERQGWLKGALEAKERQKNNLEAGIEAKDHVQEQLKAKIGQLNQHIQQLIKENEELRKREAHPQQGSTPDGEKKDGGESKERKMWRGRFKAVFEKNKGHGDGKADRRKSRFVQDELAKESFRTEVLLNTKFSAEQKDYLFSLLEKGESYVNIRPFANPAIPVEDMKRYYHLCAGKEE